MNKPRSDHEATQRQVRTANQRLGILHVRVKAIEKALKDVWFMGAVVNQLDVRVQKLEQRVKGKALNGRS